MAPTAAASSSSSEAVDKSLQYIMLVLSTCEAFKPSYHDVATKAGICDANTAQKKFKKFVEQAGYSLVKGAVINSDGGVAPADATPKKASQDKKSGTKKTKTPESNKKRKIEPSDEEMVKGE